MTIKRMDLQLLQLQKEEIELLSHKKLDGIISSPQFRNVPKKVQDEILDLRDMIDRYLTVL